MQSVARKRANRMTSLPSGSTLDYCSTCPPFLGYSLDNQVNLRMVRTQELTSLDLKIRYLYY